MAQLGVPQRKNVDERENRKEVEVHTVRSGAEWRPKHLDCAFGRRSEIGCVLCMAGSLLPAFMSISAGTRPHPLVRVLSVAALAQSWQNWVAAYGLQGRKYLLSGSLQRKIVYFWSSEKKSYLKFPSWNINSRIFIQVILFLQGVLHMEIPIRIRFIFNLFSDKKLSSWENLPVFDILWFFAVFFQKYVICKVSSF